MIETNDLYWLAGLIEGEGCFYSTTEANGGIKPRFVMSLTELGPLRHAKNIVNIGSITGPRTPRKKNEKPYWTWRVTKDRDVAALMMTVYPLMWDNRQEKIEDLIEIWKASPKVRRYVRS